MSAKHDAMADRLKQSMLNLELSQSDVAKAMNVSGAAVSQWVSGKKAPSSENMRELAKLFGCSTTYFELGQGSPPAPDFNSQRVDYETRRGFRFRRAPADQGRDYGNANVWAFDPGIPTMVRDVVQNSRDAAISASPSSPVRITFRIISLRGEELDRFLTALAWSELLPHLEASATIDQRLGRLIASHLEQFKQLKRMRLLVIEDSGTIGLTGPEFGKGNFAALCRNNLDSNKQSGTAGGAFGLGKAVLWRVSQYALVLFNSNLVEPETTEQLCRVFGRCDLPWHEIASGAQPGIFAGPGWLGKLQSDHNAEELSVSYWRNRALASDLFIDRDSTVSGTSIAVVGFHDPSGEIDDDDNKLASAIEGAVADWFWPDLTAETLRVAVEVFEGTKQVSSTQVVASRWMPEFVDALTKRERGELVEALSKEGDVVCRTVPISIPQRVQDPRHPPCTHDATILVRRAADEGSSKRTNELALYRGTGMVVQYLPLRNLCMGAVPCHAMALCGQAASESPESKMADRFLRTAEPPAHEKWTATPDLATEYARGGKKAIDSFVDAIKAAIREAVRPSVRDLSDGPRALKELLRVGEPPKPDDTPKITRPKGTVDADGSWLVDARIRMKRSEHPWRVDPVLLFQQETGGGQKVAWKELEVVTNCTAIDHNTLQIDAGVTEARFRGRTDSTTHPIDAVECAVTVELRNVARVRSES